MSEKLELSAPFIRAAKSNSRLREIVDAGFNTPGTLILRVSPKGLKTFTFRYRNLAGRQRRYGMGHYPELTLGKAREKARKLSGRVANGEDPAEDKWKQKQAAREAMSFEELARLYLRDHAKRHKAPKSQREDKRMLGKDLLPEWKDRDIQTITRGEVVKVLDAIVARGAPVAANRTRALVHAVFEFGIRKSYLPPDAVNPCRGVALPGGKEKSRERVLSEEEIKALWKALDGFEEPLGSLYRLMLWTGQRSGEVKAMCWNEIEGDLWVLPAAKTQNRLEQRVPLSRAALACVEALKEDSTSAVWVFPSRFKKTPHIKTLKKATDRLKKAGGPKLGSFTPHDLRRTMATELLKMGIDDTLIAKILGHKWADRSITSVYNRWQKLPEMRQALERWASRLEQIATGEPAKVVEMGRKQSRR